MNRLGSFDILCPATYRAPVIPLALSGNPREFCGVRPARRRRDLLFGPARLEPQDVDKANRH